MELVSQSVSATPSAVSQQLSSPLDLHSRHLPESAFRKCHSAPSRAVALYVNCLFWSTVLEPLNIVCLPSVERSTMSALN